METFVWAKEIRKPLGNGERLTLCGYISLQNIPTTAILNVYVQFKFRINVRYFSNSSFEILVDFFVCCFTGQESYIWPHLMYFLVSIKTCTNPPTRTGPAWCVVTRSPFVYSIRKACAPAVGTLIGWWCWIKMWVFRIMMSPVWRPIHESNRLSRYWWWWKPWLNSQRHLH
jgi:hypothetical protein